MLDLRKNLPVVIGTSGFWIALFIAYALLKHNHPPAQPIEILLPATPETITNCPDPTVSPTPTPAPLRVYVSGAVQHPGVYRLPPDSLVVDAIAEAGGETAHADLIAINLAHSLSDGEQIYVPTREEAASPPPPIASSRAVIAGSASPSESTSPKSIDLNTASQEELETLPGIGPAMAQRIIAARPYSTVDDLLRVKGIGDAKLEKIRPYVIVK